MPQIDADNRAKAENPTSDNVLSGGTLGGRLRIHTEVVTLAAQAANDTIRLFRTLQAGAIIQDIIIDNGALGAGVILDIGDSDTADRYINGYDAQANTTSRGATTAAAGQFQSTGVHYKIGTNAGDEDILATILIAAATGELKVTALYTED